MSKLIETAPQEIYLNVAEEPCELDEPFPPNHEDITWCEDSVLGAEVKYIRADLHDQLRARNAELERQLAEANERAEEYRTLIASTPNGARVADAMVARMQVLREVNDTVPLRAYSAVREWGLRMEQRAEQAEQRIVEKQAEALEEAAEVFSTIGHSKFKTPSEELRRMAAELRNAKERSK